MSDNPNDSNNKQSGNGTENDPGTSSPKANQESEESSGSLVDYLAQNMHLIVAEKMFAVIPLTECPHLSCVQPVPAVGINVQLPCMECGSTPENWVCLTCYTVGCGRYGNKHMQAHGEEAGHPLTLGFADLSVWCYECESYIDNQALFEAKNSAHKNKFKTEMPWSYGSD